jgi:hypothetical protein
MANNSKTQAKRSGLQTIVEVLDFFLKPLVDPDEKPTRDEILAYLGLKADFFNTPHSTDAVKSFLEKKPEDAGFIDFGKAIKQQSDIIQKIDDAVKQSATHFSNDELSKERVVNDTTTMLLNILVLENCRKRFPGFHNWMMILYSLNNFSNRGGGVVPIVELIGNYLKRWNNARKNGLKTREDARIFTEAFYMAFVAGTYGLNSLISERASKKDIDRTMLVGGQAGNETNLIKNPTKAREFAESLLNRSATLSFNFMNGGKETASTLTLITLSEEDGGSGIEIFSNNDFDFPEIKLSDNWFLSLKGAGKLNFRAGADTKNENNTDSSNSKIRIAAERLLFPKGTKAEDIDIPNLFDFFQFGFGNSSIQIEASKEDVVLRFVTQIIYAVQKTKIVDGKEKKAGFPFKFIPETKNIVDVPIRYSFKNGFGFDGGFVGERPKESDTRSLTNAPSAPTLGTYDIPIHRDIGIFRFDKLHLGFDTADGLALQATLDFTLKFGNAVVISLAEIGASLVATKRTEKPKNGGFLGYNISPKFLPPKGAGIAIDANVIKGGGFLYFNEPKGEYFGAIELSVRNLFDLKAIGIIRTRDDAGKEQFSLFILITAEFTPIQLGLGFTLNGVGGMLALNRRANVAYLQENLSNGVLDSILFPRNVIANMSRIISNLTTAFPIQDNRFAIGLMAKIGWGTPQIVSLDLGIIVEFPDTRILLPGILRINFPNEAHPIVSIKAAFLGILDFKNKFAYFRAELINSSIFTFPLSGSMAFGISWGDSPVFVFSAGGFHPRFREIPSLPTLPNAFSGLNRLRLQFLDVENPRIIVESYIAATSNTVQFGGKIEFFYDIFSGEGGYNIYGRLQADTLIQFDPFHFIIDIAADLALKDGSETVMGISISGTLEGPTPWHISVTASVEVFWFFSIDVDLDKIWGNRTPELPATTAKVADLLRGAVKDVRNWQTLINNATNVSLRKENESGAQTRDIGTPDKIRLDPSGGLKFSQNIAPLDFDLKKFGNQRSDLTRASIRSVKFGDTEISRTAVRDFFAPEMFTPLNDDERLSRPSYERMTSGFELASSDQLKLGDARPMAVSAEVSEANRKAIDPQNINAKNDFRRLVRSSSTTFRSEASLNNRAKKQAYQHLEPTAKDSFVITQKDTMAKAAAFRNVTFGSFAEADNALRKMSLAQRKQLQVIDSQELV